MQGNAGAGVDIPACMRHRWNSCREAPRPAPPIPPTLLQVTAPAVLPVLDMICSRGTQGLARSPVVEETGIPGRQRYQRLVGVLSTIPACIEGFVKHGSIGEEALKHLMPLTRFAILEWSDRHLHQPPSCLPNSPDNAPDGQSCSNMPR